MRRCVHELSGADSPCQLADSAHTVRPCTHLFLQYPQGFCDSAGPGGTCTYHYTSAGYQWIAETMAAAIKKLL